MDEKEKGMLNKCAYDIKLVMIANIVEGTNKIKNDIGRLEKVTKIILTDTSANKDLSLFKRKV